MPSLDKLLETISNSLSCGETTGAVSAPASYLVQRGRQSGRRPGLIPRKWQDWVQAFGLQLSRLF